MIGLLSETTAGELDMANIEVDESGLITMTVLSEDEQERTITFSTDVENSELHVPSIYVIHEHE